MQIKYIRIPENLLDAVKDEQNRAREANRSSTRGGAGRGGRGGPMRGTLPNYQLCSTKLSILQVVEDEEHLCVAVVGVAGECETVYVQFLHYDLLQELVLMSLFTLSVQCCSCVCASNV